MRKGEKEFVNFHVQYEFLYFYYYIKDTFNMILLLLFNIFFF